MNREQEDLLIAVMAGDLAPEDARVQAACARDPQFAQRLAELREIEHRLSASMPAGLERLPPIEGEERILRGFREVVEPPQNRKLALRLAPWLAVAALVLGIFWLGTRFSRDENPTRGPITLSDAPAGYAPVGEVAAFEDFRWPDALPSGGSYELRIFDARSGRLLTSVEEWAEPFWKPSAEELAAWPRSIRWELSVRDSSRALHGSPRSFSAQLR